MNNYKITVSNGQCGLQTEYADTENEAFATAEKLADEWDINVRIDILDCSNPARGELPVASRLPGETDFLSEDGRAE